MNLVILHHHLNRGGVSQVIANHLRSLAALPAGQQPRRVVVVFDGQRDGWPNDVPDADATFPIELLTVPDIGYDAAGAVADGSRLASTIGSALAAAGLNPNDSLLHVHNHSIGKNASLPGALAELARNGWRQLLQVHDFAEDNRPSNYRHLAEALLAGDPDALGGRLYPQAAHVHYATLTQRDAAVLAEAGIAADRLEPLANPVAEFGDLPASAVARPRVHAKLALPDDARLFVYPVRGIRRKNMGELLLLAAVAPDDAWFAVTLAPKNPAEYASFDAWSELARRLALRCRFDTGGQFGVTFPDALAAADAIVTTSIAEGFGMVFLEAWLANRVLVGRDLPEITTEFRDEGLQFDGLYEALAIPLQLLDERGVREDWQTVYVDTCQKYGLPPLAVEDFNRRVEPLLAGGCVDFGRLAPARQAAVIEQVAADVAARDAILAANPALAKLFATKQGDQQSRIDANAAAVRQRYSTAAVGQRLDAAYQRVLDSPVDETVAPAPRGRAVLDHFVTPERILPVRVAQWTT
ncbi:MAG: hypothetical protein CMJ58_27270 [Planctomycetaceae bacterium]|nr:hypothetical protein [Planctomycetaceae bacterium]